MWNKPFNWFAKSWHTTIVYICYNTQQKFNLSDITAVISDPMRQDCGRLISSEVAAPGHKLEGPTLPIHIPN